MTTIKHAGKFINCLPTAIQQVLQHVQFNSDAPSREPPEDQAEYEEDPPLEEEPQGVPSAGTPPGTPPPWNPREVSSTSRTGRVQKAVQRIEAPQTSNVPAPKWHGWKTQTGPTIADMEQSRMSPFGEPESEMADPDLREAMIRSLHEMTHDPHEPPVTDGASGSGAAARHNPSPQQANSPMQSDGDGSVLPNRPPRTAAEVTSQPSAQLQSDDITSADICLILEDRINKQKLRIAELIDKMGSIDRDFTEADFAELNDLKQSVAGCRRSLEQARQEQQVTGIPRPPVHLPSNDPPASEDPTPAERRKSRSRPWSVRGRSKRDRRHPDSGDRRPSRRRKGKPIVVVPEVIIPRPTVASLFQGGVEELSSSCPTSQEPVQSVPYLFQTAGTTLSVGGWPQAPPPRGITTDQPGPPRDPRSQSVRRRRVSIQTPPATDDPPEAQIPVPFAGRPLPPRSASAEPQLPPGDYSVLESRRDPHQQGRSTYYGR